MAAAVMTWFRRRTQAAMVSRIDALNLAADQVRHHAGANLRPDCLDGQFVGHHRDRNGNCKQCQRVHRDILDLARELERRRDLLIEQLHKTAGTRPKTGRPKKPVEKPRTRDTSKMVRVAGHSLARIQVLKCSARDGKRIPWHAAICECGIRLGGWHTTKAQAQAMHLDHKRRIIELVTGA